MTRHELNTVRNWKGTIKFEQEKLEALRTVLNLATTNSTAETQKNQNENVAYAFETVARMINTGESRIAHLQHRLEFETPILARKIQAEFKDEAAQRLMMEHYINDKSLSEIAEMQGYSLAHARKLHIETIRGCIHK